jgi:hypothetical protein
MGTQRPDDNSAPSSLVLDPTHVATIVLESDEDQEETVHFLSITVAMRSCNDGDPVR